MTDRVSLEKQIAEAGRELALRKSFYPQQVGRGKMRQAEADYLIANMEAILETLMWCRDNADTIRKVHAAIREQSNV